MTATQGAQAMSEVIESKAMPNSVEGTLSFFASSIRCKDDWGKCHEDAYNSAMASYAALKADFESALNGRITASTMLASAMQERNRFCVELAALKSKADGLADAAEEAYDKGITCTCHDDEELELRCYGCGGGKRRRALFAALTAYREG